MDGMDWMDGMDGVRVSNGSDGSDGMLVEQTTIENKVLLQEGKWRRENEMEENRIYGALKWTFNSYDMYDYFWHT